MQKVKAKDDLLTYLSLTTVELCRVKNNYNPTAKFIMETKLMQDFEQKLSIKNLPYVNFQSFVTSKASMIKNFKDL
jgi:hypothetical protein